MITKKPKRILQVLTIMNRGGAENMIMNYYRAIDKNEIQFDFLLHRAEKGAFEDEILSLGGNIFKFPPISALTYNDYKKKLNHFFKEHPEYQIIHSHLDSLSFIILGVAKKYNIKTRIAHSHLAIEPFGISKFFKKNNDFVETVKDMSKFLLRRKVLASATHYFACSLKAGIWLYGKKNVHNIQIINNAIDTPTFIFNEAKSLKVKNELGLANKKVIGHVGRFNDQKNHFFLIKIFNELLKNDKSMVLLLVGDGSLRPKVEIEIKKMGITENIIFLGLRNDVPEILQAMDLLLFPSLYEGLPVSLIEAQASGLKIITSNTVSDETGITDLVHFYDLNQSEQDWSKLVLNNLNYERKNRYKDIVDAKYDIKENAKELQSFYFKN